MSLIISFPLDLSLLFPYLENICNFFSDAKQVREEKDEIIYRGDVATAASSSGATCTPEKGAPPPTAATPTRAMRESLLARIGSSIEKKTEARRTRKRVQRPHGECITSDEARRRLEEAESAKKGKKQRRNPESFCAGCRKDFTDDDEEYTDYAGCDHCTSWYHLECSGLQSISEDFVCSACIV